MNKIIVGWIMGMIGLFAGTQVVVAVPNPTESIYWTDSGGFFDGRYSAWPDRIESFGGAQFNTIDDIVFAYNRGRRGEESQLGLPVGAYQLFNIPSPEAWYALSPSERALIIINDERVARGLVPLEGTHPMLNQFAADYAAHLTTNNMRGHTDANGRSLQQRFDEDLPVNNCYEVGGGENLAYYPAAVVSIPIELAIYEFIYTNPPGGSWYHRQSILSEMSESINSPDTEGYLGAAISTSDSYLYPDYGGATAAVFFLLDPHIRNDNCPWSTSASLETTPLTVHLESKHATSSQMWRTVVMMTIGLGALSVCNVAGYKVAK